MIANLPKIVATGDSLIYGRHDPPCGGWIGRLRSWVESRYQWGAVYNLGVGGHDTRKVLRRIESEFSSRNFNGVILGVGTNDARRRSAPDEQQQVPLPEFRSNFDDILKICSSVSDRVFVASVTPVDEFCTQPLQGIYYFNKDLDAYREVQEELCTKYGALFLDFWAAINDSEDKVFTDGVHLNSDGHELLFRCALKSIRESYGFK